VDRAHAEAARGPVVTKAPTVGSSFIDGSRRRLLRAPTSPSTPALPGTKTEASDAWLPMPDIVTAALKIRRGQQDEEREAAAEIWQQAKDVPSLIFTGRNGTPIDPRTLNRKFAARCEAAEVRPITVHDARHTCATLLVDLDVHPRVIMRILRHAD
jgi:integrase